MQSHSLSGLNRLNHGVRIGGLNPDHLDLGADCLEIGRHAGDQAAAADRDEHGINRPLVLAQDFHADGALARNHVRVVEGVHEREVLGVSQFQGMFVGVRVAVAEQHDFAATGADCIDLDLRGGDRHDDDGPAAQTLSAQGNSLSMIACRRADHATLKLLLRQAGHLVVGASQLEAEDGLGVLALEQDPVAESA